MIALVDYGLGNIQAFFNIYKLLNIPVTVATHPEDLVRADKIILPGVGAFDWAMERLDESGMRACLDDLVMNLKRPVLGICVGLQMMALRSEEGMRKGMGWLDAEVVRFRASPPERAIRLPHMGWNDARPRIGSELFRGMEPGARFYFLHSYHIVASRPDDVIALTDYGSEFPSVLGAGNIFGTQFHPEKSHKWGIQLLRNFAEM